MTLDSLHLAIEAHNKAVDDSLRRDSIQRAKKNGIEAPVNYTANDSIVYDAITGLAHLYGSSNIDYQNMNLKSEKIYLSLDSSLVRATASRTPPWPSATRTTATASRVHRLQDGQ